MFRLAVLFMVFVGMGGCAQSGQYGQYGGINVSGGGISGDTRVFGNVSVQQYPSFGGSPSFYGQPQAQRGIGAVQTKVCKPYSMAILIGSGGESYVPQTISGEVCQRGEEWYFSQAAVNDDDRLCRKSRMVLADGESADTAVCPSLREGSWKLSPHKGRFKGCTYSYTLVEMYDHGYKETVRVFVPICPKGRYRFVVTAE
jgi:hypothetical protein